jgi:carboxyl-terminal processing protease
MTLASFRWPLVAVLAIAAGGCNGGGRSDAQSPPPPPSPAPPPGPSWVTGTFLPASTFEAQCVSPRTGTNPLTNEPYPDTLGTTLSQNNWLRSWSNETYLWYDEIVDVNPANYATASYFDLLKTNSTTGSGAPKDKFHFTYATTEWIALAQSGTSAGYGVEWAVVRPIPPRNIVAAYVQPGSPAATAGVRRGMSVISVDGADVEFSNSPSLVDTFVAGLFPEQPGETHTFRLRDRDFLLSTITLQSASITMDPVPTVLVHSTLSGPVGYVLFNDHVATAERALIDAFTTLKSANIVDLVLDLRYNGGGFLGIASELAYMIAGPVPTAGRTFEHLRFNDKHASVDPVTGETLAPLPFADTAIGYSAASGGPLPTLNLPRVFVLTGGSTCSASESIINSLRGVNVQVIQIGGGTCGKPYGFYPTDNCGTTYFTIQFKGVNDAGFGDYTDGFVPSNSFSLGERVPGCAVGDDFARALGDPLEARFAAALAYRDGGPQACPMPASTSQPGFSKPLSAGVAESLDGIVFKSPWLQNRSLVSPR